MSENRKGPTIGFVGTGRGNAEVMIALAGQVEPRPPITDPIAKAPDLVGPHGRAWLFDLETARRELYDGQQDATVCVWMAEAAWAHPIWHSYIVVLIHLRPVPGMQKPHLYRPDATHEFWIFAANPDHPREPQIAGKAGLGFLTPKNFGAQLAMADDAAAMEEVERAVRDILGGVISPDTDWFSAWAARFGDAMVKPEYR